MTKLFKKQPNDRKYTSKNLRAVAIEPSRYENTPSLYDTDFSRTSASAAMLKNMANTIAVNGDYVAMPGEFPVTNKDGSINIQETLKDVGYDNTTQSIDMKRYTFNPYSENLYLVNKKILDSGNRQALHSLIFNRAQLTQESSARAGSEVLAKKVAQKIKSTTDVDKFMNAEAKKMKKLYNELFAENKKYGNVASEEKDSVTKFAFLNYHENNIGMILQKISRAQFITQHVTGFRAMATPDVKNSNFNSPSMQFLLNQIRQVPTQVYPVK